MNGAYSGVVLSTLFWLGCGASSPADPTPQTGGAAGASGTATGGVGTAGTASGGMITGGGGSTSGGGGSTAGGTATGGVAGGGEAGATGGSPTGGTAGSGGSGTTNPPGVPSDYTLVLDLPFSSADTLPASLLAANPSAWKVDSGSLLFTGAGYTAPPSVGESLTSFAIIKTTKLSSFVLDVELQQTNTDASQPHRDLCIVFDAADDEHFYYAHIAATHDERSHNIHLINAAPRKPITLTNSGGIQWGPPGTWHAFRLVRNAASGEIAVYADGKLDQAILTANDKTFTAGYIGFGTFQDGGRVRNLKVWSKSAEATPAANFFGN
jgi:hypothetical protein